MATEKTPELLIPNDQLDEKKPKQKYCTKAFLSWVLTALLIALIVTLCVQFLFPVAERNYKTTIDVVHKFDGLPVDNPFETQDDNGKARNKHTKEESVNPSWHLDFLINPTRLCETFLSSDSEVYMKDPEVKLLILVPSAVNHFSERRVIRKTWGSVAVKPNGPVRLGFVLGTTPNATEEDLVLHESESFGDIIQADFQDNHHNLTTKSVLMLKWVTKYCAHAQYFLKADDDTFVNLGVLTKLLEQPPFTSHDKFIGGFIHQGVQPSRNPEERYYVSVEDYPADHYPPYASGSAYVTTGNTASKLFAAAKDVKPFLPMEDIYITGLCADDIDAVLIHEPSFRFDSPPQPAAWDSYSNLATVRNMTPDSLDLLWDQLTKSILEHLLRPASLSLSLDTLESESTGDAWYWSGSDSLSGDDLTWWDKIDLNREESKSSLSEAAPSAPNAKSNEWNRQSLPVFPGLFPSWFGNGNGDWKGKETKDDWSNMGLWEEEKGLPPNAINSQDSPSVVNITYILFNALQ